MANARELIGKARFEFLLKHPFLGDLSLRLKVIEDSKLVQTMGTDSKNLFYCESFVQSLSQPNLLGVIAHEIAHCIFGHAGKSGVERQGGKSHSVWTIACEFMVNHFVIDMCELTLPGNPVGVGDLKQKHDGQIHYYDRKYADGAWTTEAIYYDLLRHIEEGVQAITLDFHGMWGEAQGTEAGAEDHEWKIWISQAMHAAKRKGKLPLGAERLVGDLLEPKLPWQYYLADFVLEKSRDDYSWKRPNKRHLTHGFYTPALHSEVVTVGFAMDTSGSMSEQELAEGLAEIRGICNTFESYRLHLFACDAHVHHYQEVTPEDQIDIAGLCKGGGGTDFRPVFDKIEQEDIPIKALVYFTDAYGTFPDKEPDYPVLWVVKGTGETPWGRRVEYD